VRDDSNFLFRYKLLVEDGSVRRCVVMVKQPGLFSPKFGATSSNLFTQSSQNFAVDPGIHIRAGVSRYHNCCIDGGFGSEYFGYYFVYKYSGCHSTDDNRIQVVPSGLMLPFADCCVGRLAAGDLLLLSFRDFTIRPGTKALSV
jgi:hypothetical protein